MRRKKWTERIHIICNTIALAAFVIGCCYCLLGTSLYFTLGCFGVMLAGSAIAKFLK